MKKVIKWLDDNLEVFCCVILMSVMAILIFYQVVMRYVFQNSQSWTEELARYIFIWLIFLGISYGCKLRKHIKIDAALHLFPKKSQKYVVLLGDIIFLGFAIFITVTGYMYAAQQAANGRASSALHIPYQFVCASAPVGFALVCLREVQTIIYRIKCIKNKEEYDG